MADDNAVSDGPDMGAPSWIQPDVDPSLADLIKLADVSIEFSVTLFVRGTIVAGKVISGKKYYDGLADGMRGANVLGKEGSEIQEALIERYEQFAAEYSKPAVPGDAGGNPSIAYIHLADAKFSLPDGFSERIDVLWRGKLTSVDGFIIGSIID